MLTAAVLRRLGLNPTTTIDGHASRALHGSSSGESDVLEYFPIGTFGKKRFMLVVDLNSILADMAAAYSRELAAYVNRSLDNNTNTNITDTADDASSTSSLPPPPPPPRPLYTRVDEFFSLFIEATLLAPKLVNVRLVLGELSPPSSSASSSSRATHSSSSSPSSPSPSSSSSSASLVDYVVWYRVFAAALALARTTPDMCSFYLASGNNIGNTNSNAHGRDDDDDNHNGCDGNASAVSGGVCCGGFFGAQQLMHAHAVEKRELWSKNSLRQKSIHPIQGQVPFACVCSSNPAGLFAAPHDSVVTNLYAWAVSIIASKKQQRQRAEGGGGGGGGGGATTADSSNSRAEAGAGAPTVYTHVRVTHAAATADALGLQRASTLPALYAALLAAEELIASSSSSSSLLSPSPSPSSTMDTVAPTMPEEAADALLSWTVALLNRYAGITGECFCEELFLKCTAAAAATSTNTNTNTTADAVVTADDAFGFQRSVDSRRVLFAFSSSAAACLDSTSNSNSGGSGGGSAGPSQCLVDVLQVSHSTLASPLPRWLALGLAPPPPPAHAQECGKKSHRRHRNCCLFPPLTNDDNTISNIINNTFVCSGPAGTPASRRPLPDALADACAPLMAALHTYVGSLVWPNDPAAAPVARVAETKITPGKPSKGNISSSIGSGHGNGVAHAAIATAGYCCVRGCPYLRCACGCVDGEPEADGDDDDDDDDGCGGVVTDGSNSQQKRQQKHQRSRRPWRHFVAGHLLPLNSILVVHSYPPPPQQLTATTVHDDDDDDDDDKSTTTTTAAAPARRTMAPVLPSTAALDLIRGLPAPHVQLPLVALLLLLRCSRCIGGLFGAKSRALVWLFHFIRSSGGGGGGATSSKHRAALAVTQAELSAVQSAVAIVALAASLCDQAGGGAYPSLAAAGLLPAADVAMAVRGHGFLPPAATTPSTSSSLTATATADAAGMAALEFVPQLLRPRELEVWAQCKTALLEISAEAEATTTTTYD